MEKIGFVGLGTMGMPMATRLIEAGYLVYPMDIDPMATKKMISKGGKGVASYSELSKLTQVIVFSLPNSKVVESILYSPGMMIDTIEPGTIIVDLGTSDPLSTRKIAKDLQAIGAVLIDAPVTGGPVRAEDGTLSCMVGGPTDAYEQVKPLLKKMAKNIEYVGESGMGHTIKLLNNMVGVGNLVLLCEVFSIAEKLDVDLEKLERIMSVGSAKSFALDFWGKRLIEKDYIMPVYKFSLAAKDMRLAQKIAAEVDLPYPVFASVHQLFLAGNALGMDQEDVCCIKKVWDRLL